MSFGQDTSDFIIGNLATYTGTVFHQLLLSWPAQTITTLYCVIGGYTIIMGNAGKHAKEMGISIFLLIVLQAVVQSGFDGWVVRPVLDTIQGLSQLAIDPASANGYSDVFSKLDDGLGQIMTTIDRIEPPGNLFTHAWMYVKVGAVSFVLAVAYGLLYVVFLVLYLVAWTSIYMMLMVGSIFLWLGAFKATRQYTMAWFKAILNYGLWLFFLSAIMGFSTAIISAYVADTAKWDLAVQGPFPPSAGKLIFFCLLTAWLLLKAADWSATLTGGSAMSPGIVTSGMSAVGGAIGGAAKSEAGKAVMGGIGSAAGASFRGAGRLAAGGAVRAFSALKGLR